MADLAEYRTLIADVNRIRKDGPPEGTSFRDAVAPKLARIKEIKVGLTKDQIKEVRGEEAKAMGGKVRGYAHGTPKGGVKKMSACKGRKAASSAEKA